MSMFGWLTGQDARDDIQQGLQQGNNALQKGWNQAQGLGQNYYGQSQKYLDPMISQGAQGQKAYMDALGLNGPEAQQRYYARFQNDPGFQATVDARVGALDKSAAGNGGLYSGGHMTAVADAGQQMQYQQFQDRLARLQGLGQTGQQAGMAGSQNALAFGNQLMQGQSILGQQMAGNFMSAANASAGTQNALANNIIGFMGNASKAAQAMTGKMG